MRKLTAIVVVAVLAFTGCGGEEPTTPAAEPEPTAIVTVAPEDAEWDEEGLYWAFSGVWLTLVDLEPELSAEWCGYSDDPEKAAGLTLANWGSNSMWEQYPDIPWGSQDAINAMARVVEEECS